MNKPLASLRSVLRRNRGSSAKRAKRLAAWSAALGAVALVSGLLQSASAASLLAGPVLSSTNLASTPATPTVGLSVTYTAKVTDFTLGTVAPTGTVEFKDGTNSINETDSTTTLTNCDSVPIDSSTGEATCTTVQRLAGSHTINAKYSGDSTYAESSGVLIQTVDKADTTTALQSSDTTAVAAQTVTYTATVSGEGSEAVDGGTVQFQSGGVDIPNCGAQTMSTTTPGQFTCQQTFGSADVGTHSITAIYHGATNGNYNDSPTSNSVSQGVDKASTSTALSSSLNPAKTGQNVTYTAAVSAASPATGTPTGSVTFKDGSSNIPTSASCTNPATLINGSASCTVNYSNSSVGNHSITGVYSPDASSDPTYLASTSNTVTEVVTYPYVLAATISSGTTADPSNASFKISNGPATNYTLCVRLDGAWNGGVRAGLVTPEPVGGEPGETWATQWTLNTHDRCKSYSWGSGSSSTKSLYPDFGFAAKGTYVGTWHLGSSATGAVIGTDTVDWNSWCPPQDLRNQGVWRPSRHKAIDWCRSDTRTSTTSGSVGSDYDRGFSWGGLKTEYVARDHYYSNPTTGDVDLLPKPGNKSWTLWGKYICDLYHGHKEFHPVWYARNNVTGDINISGPQYSTKTPSISGTWSTQAC